jgi:hypothetical protein
MTEDKDKPNYADQVGLRLEANEIIGEAGCLLHTRVDTEKPELGTCYYVRVGKHNYLIACIPQVDKISVDIIKLLNRKGQFTSYTTDMKGLLYLMDVQSRELKEARATGVRAKGIGFKYDKSKIDAEANRLADAIGAIARTMEAEKEDD